MKSQPTPAAATTSRRSFLQIYRARRLRRADDHPRHRPEERRASGSSERVTMACFGFGDRAFDRANFLNDERVQTVAIADPAKDLPGYGYSRELRGGREEETAPVMGALRRAKESGEYKGCATYGDFRELLGETSMRSTSARRTTGTPSWRSPPRGRASTSAVEAALADRGGRYAGWWRR
ncbi:MAG: hypothetical protein R3F11_27265 [Verrucomicrobiales bacterium]